MNSDFLSDLNLQQKRAVTFGNGPLLILAGAGSGKTRALTYRAAYLVLAKDVDPSEILLVTFTNKAANEMKERIRKLLTTHNSSLITHNPQPTASLPFAGTFHSFCVRVLKREGKLLGIESDFVIYDEQDQLDLVKQIIKQADLGTFKPASILAAISGAKNELISELEYYPLARDYFTKTVAQVYLEYQKLLKKYHALDFDDLLTRTVQLFQHHRPVLNRYQNKFKFILVDEYQDTNHAQYELTRLLAKSHQNLTVVGDCSQSIYSWRGADFRNVMRLQNDFPRLTTINLERNYRSPQTILDAAFSVISKNKSHPILKLWTDKSRGEKITLYQAKDELDEANFIVRTIRDRIDSDPGSDRRSNFYTDFAVLYRTNAQSRVLEETFLHASIPYVLVGGVRFYQRKEIKDCLAYLRFLANAKDDVSYKRLEKLGKTRLKKFLTFAENYSIKQKTEKILDNVLKTSGYLELFDPKDEADLARLDNIKELYSVAKQFPALGEFLENVALIEKENLPQNPIKNGAKKNAVTLMTLHAAKGLEFENVFMIGMEEGLFPHARSFLDKNELEEERRLCYVGITRTKKKLYLTYTNRRLYFGNYSSNELSRFVIDLPQNLIETEYASLLEE
jgi:DNA helicase-2/ATP-dependent DNA helicase PcrA